MVGVDVIKKVERLICGSTATQLEEWRGWSAKYKIHLGLKKKKLATRIKKMFCLIPSEIRMHNTIFWVSNMFIFRRSQTSQKPIYQHVMQLDHRKKEDS